MTFNRVDFETLLEDLSQKIPLLAFVIVEQKLGGPNNPSVPAIKVINVRGPKWYKSIDVETKTTTTGNTYFDVIFNIDENKLEDVPLYINARASGDSGIDKYTVEQQVGVSTRIFTVKGYTITGENLPVSQFVLDVTGFV